MASSKKTILIVGTLDTKGEECVYIRTRLEKRGQSGLIIDPGPMGDALVPGDIPRDQVAQKAGWDLQDLVATADKGRIIQAMTDGLTAWVSELLDAGRIHGIIAVGGGQGTAMGTAAMQVPPLGFPKVMVSTIASGNMRPFVGTKDIAVFHSVTDVFGLNFLFRRILDNAIASVAAMAMDYRPVRKGTRKVVGATAFGVTTAGLMKMKRMFEAQGVEMILFHANGTGGRAMEELAGAGYFDGLVDWTTHEVVDLLYDGIFSPGDRRLELPSKSDIPCIVAPGAIDYICKGPFETLDPAWQQRLHIIHNRNITNIRTTAAELDRAARFMAERLSRAIGPIRVMIPLKGFSEPDAAGKPFYDPGADRTFVDVLKTHMRADIDIVERPHHINDDRFVREAVDTMMAMLG